MSSRRSIPTTDRISALPDSLIYHILSFLPTKLSIATSVLSKRWTQLWKSVLTLDFNDQSFTDFSNFRHFVYSVIVSRDITLPLQSFRISIKCQSNFDPRDVNRFVHAAVQQGIQNLDIDVVPLWEAAESEETVPGLFRVLSCRTLVVLILNALTFHDVPQSVDLPLLKTLHLSCILCYNNGNFMNLLRGCPILENFHTTNVGLCQFSNDLAAEFNGFPKLVKAKLSEPGREFPFVWFRNATFLHAELDSIYELRVPTFHNLTHMKLIFATASDEVEKWKWKWVTRLLQHCPKLQNFIIERYCLYGPPTIDIDWNDPEVIPECLSYQLRTCSIRDFYGTGCELQFVEYILLNSKLLRTMTIKSHKSVGGHETHQMLVKLSSYPRGSVTCRLLFA